MRGVDTLRLEGFTTSRAYYGLLSLYKPAYLWSTLDSGTRSGSAESDQLTGLTKVDEITKSRKLELLQRDFKQPVQVHAEVQILMHLVDSRHPRKPDFKEFDYIGCSKKSCFLCWSLLRGFYCARGSHGKIYPRWMVLNTSMLEDWCCLKIHTKVTEMGLSMIERLSSRIKNRILYVAESTVAITDVSAAPLARKYRGRLD